MPTTPTNPARHPTRAHQATRAHQPTWIRRAGAGLAALLVLGVPAATATTAAAAPASTQTPSQTRATGEHPSYHRHSARGTIVSATHLEHLTKRQVTTALEEVGFDTSRVRFGVDTVRLVYRTVDVDGRPTTASGLVVLPRGGQRHLRLVSYAHGTMASRSSAPSVDDHGRSAEGLAFGSAGYAVAAPDYLGLGTGPGHHPYLHARSQTTASVDMLRAANQFAGRVHRHLDRRVLVTGFSQGGAVAMQLAKALHRGALPGWRPALVAPISGPYDLRGAEIPAMLAGRLDPRAAAYYSAYLLTSWQRIYNLGTKPSEVFNAPYDVTVPPLFDGDHSDEQIIGALPASFRELLTPSELKRMARPNGAFGRALDENDRSCRGWTPGVPIRIFAAHGDEQVAIDNAYSCQRDLADRGVRAPLVDLGDLGHFESGRQGLAAVLELFLREAAPSRG